MRNILLAEDDMGLREALSDFLQNEGYSVTVASDGKSAIHLGHDNNVTWFALITDFHMGEVSGVEVIQHFEKNNISFQKRILMSAHADNFPEIAAVLSSPDITYLAKPFDISKLLHVLL